jgi:hypothetical protein
VPEIAAMLKAIHAGEDICGGRQKAVQVIEKLRGLPSLMGRGRRSDQHRSAITIPTRWKGTVLQTQNEFILHYLSSLHVL